MKVVCAWCQPNTGEKVNHGICPACTKKLREQLKQMFNQNKDKNKGE